MIDSSKWQSCRRRPGSRRRIPNVAPTLAIGVRSSDHDHPTIEQAQTNSAVTCSRRQQRARWRPRIGRRIIDFGGRRQGRRRSDVSSRGEHAAVGKTNQNMPGSSSPHGGDERPGIGRGIIDLRIRQAKGIRRQATGGQDTAILKQYERRVGSRDGHIAGIRPRVRDGIIKLPGIDDPETSASIASGDEHLAIRKQNGSSP